MLYKVVNILFTEILLCAVHKFNKIDSIAQNLYKGKKIQMMVESPEQSHKVGGKLSEALTTLYSVGQKNAEMKKLAMAGTRQSVRVKHMKSAQGCSVYIRRCHLTKPRHKGKVEEEAVSGLMNTNNHYKKTTKLRSHLRNNKRHLQIRRKGKS